MTDDSEPNKMSLFEFSHKYRFHDIPVIDFIAIYIIVYYVSHLTNHYDFKIVLLSSVLLTLGLNFFTSSRTTKRIPQVMCLIIIVYAVMVFFVVKKKLNN